MTEKLEELKTLIVTMVKLITKNPEDVAIHADDKACDDKGDYTIINIKVSGEDVPICIGTGGTTADAIRRLACLFARNIGYTRRLYVRIDAPVMPKNHFFKS